MTLLYITSRSKVFCGALSNIKLNLIEDSHYLQCHTIHPINRYKLYTRAFRAFSHPSQCGSVHSLKVGIPSEDCGELRD